MSPSSVSLPIARLDPNRGALEDPGFSVGNPGVALPGRLNRDLAAGWLTPPPQIPLQKPGPPPMRIRLTVVGNPKLAVALKLDLAGRATCSNPNNPLAPDDSLLASWNLQARQSGSKLGL